MMTRAVRQLGLLGMWALGTGCSSSASGGGAMGIGGAPVGVGGAGGLGGEAGMTGGGDVLAPGTGGAVAPGTGGAVAPGTGGALGGAPDAAPPDAGAREDSGGVAGCAGLFCEDFEKGVIDPAVWDLKVNAGQSAPAVVTQAGLVAHGKYAAHFRANPNVVSYDFIITKTPPPGLRGHHFGRAYFMITPMPPANHTEYVYAGTTGFPQYQYLEVASAAPLVWQLTYVDLVPPSTGENYHSGGKVPVGQWICLEWEFNDAPDTAAVFVDGTLAFAQNSFALNGSTTGLVGGFAAFGFGYYVWHPASYAFDVYYDDIVLDSKRVGCLP